MLLTTLKNHRTSSISLILFCLCAALFITYPQLDLIISGAFYNPETEAFIYRKQLIIVAIYKLFAVIHLPILLALILTGILYKIGVLKLSKLKKWTITFLLTALILGPGLIVNTVLKDNSIGRARPVQVDNFGGNSQFTPAFVYSGECAKNCSFVSGHAAMGFYFMILGWLFTSARWFWAGTMIGVILSFTRIVQGGHFFSDTLFAFWVVFFVTSLLGYLFNFKHPLNK